jgi:hypothetical protein
VIIVQLPTQRRNTEVLRILATPHVLFREKQQERQRRERSTFKGERTSPLCVEQ